MSAMQNIEDSVREDHRPSERRAQLGKGVAGRELAFESGGHGEIKEKRNHAKRPGRLAPVGPSFHALRVTGDSRQGATRDRQAGCSADF